VLRRRRSPVISACGCGATRMWRARTSLEAMIQYTDRDAITVVITNVAPESSRSGFEQLDRIAVGILDLDLLAARSRLHLIAKAQAGLLQRLDE
jgi:hypothetical protein